LLIALALWFGGSRAHRSYSLGGREDIAGLVRAAAVHPEAFAGMHVLFARRVIPLLGGRSISMARARAAAARGRLAVGGRHRGLAVRAAARGRPWQTDGVKAERDLAPEEFISREVDPILDKISAHGIQSLTERERKILADAQKKMAKR